MHLFSADLPGLIHKQDRIARQLPPGEQPADRFHVVKTGAFQIQHLLPLRSDHLNKAAGLLQFPLHFPQRVTFSRPRAAAKQRDKTP